MKTPTKFNRRHWLRLGLGVATGSMAGLSAIGKATDPDTCKTTPALELGPFPPMKSRSQLDHDVDLTQVTGQSGTAKGELLEVSGRILDDDCKPVEGAIVETWQANHFGKYNHEFNTKGEHDPNFQGWGQVITNAEGRFSFKTVVPGLYASRARHIHYKVSKRGYHEMVTQLYFDGEERNKTDGIYNDLTHEEQKQVTRTIDRSSALAKMDFDIHIRQAKPGKVTEKVLQSYTGKYKLDCTGGIERLVNELYGKEFTSMIIEITNRGETLYMTMPITPTMEVIWKAKDTFDANAFYNMSLVFKRGTDEKVNRLVLAWDAQNSFEAVRTASL